MFHPEKESVPTRLSEASAGVELVRSTVPAVLTTTSSPAAGIVVWPSQLSGSNQSPVPLAGSQFRGVAETVHVRISSEAADVMQNRFRVISSPLVSWVNKECCLNDFHTSWGMLLPDFQT